MKSSLVSVTVLLISSLAFGGEVKLPSDGKSDATGALQAELGTGGKDIYVPPGDYLLGTVDIPANTRLTFASAAHLTVDPAKLRTLGTTPEEGGVRRTKTKHPLFVIKGDNVRIEGIHFDFGSGGTDKNPTPADILVFAVNVQAPVVSGAYVEAPKPEAGEKDPRVLFEAVRCRDVVLENSGARKISHMVHATQCTNVTSRGNWMMGDSTNYAGSTITTFAGGSENLKHYGNWSRQIGYQVVWRGGSPDPSRKAPNVPLGTANVVHRGVNPGDEGYIPHTEGVFDVQVSNNYAEYGTSLSWGNKGRQTVVTGNIARFMWDYAFGTEGGENLIFANNLVVNDAVAGFCSLYWGENLLITGNMVIVKHEPFVQEYTDKPESTYYGQFVRLHHGPSNPEDKYGAGGAQITGNLFVNELADRPSGISIEAGRDVLISGNKIINGFLRKSEELAVVTKDDTGKDEFTSSKAGGTGGKQIERRMGTDLGRVTIMGNEFISRSAGEKCAVMVDGFVSSAVIKDNVFRREPSILTFTDEQRKLEQAAPRYMLFSGEKTDLANASPTTAISFSALSSGNPIIQGNLILGWKNSIEARNASKADKVTFVVTGNTVDGKITVDPSGATAKKLEGNIEIPAGTAP